MDYSKIKKLKILGAFFLLSVFAPNNLVLAGEKWVKINSKNFQLVGNAEVKDIIKVAAKLEQFRFVFSRIYDKMRLDSSIPTTVLVFRDNNSFSNFKPFENGKRKDWVGGFFQPGEDLNYITLSIEGSEEKYYRTIFHEYTHFLINNTLKRKKIPAWLNEGLAGYFEKTEIENTRKVRLGAVSKTQIDLLKSHNLIASEDFFNTDYSLLETRNETEINLFYAQSWALIHYLMHGKSGARKTQLSDFLDLLAKGEKSNQAFKDAFRADYQKIENELKNYIAQNLFQNTIVNLENKLKFDDELTSNPIPEAEVKAIQGDLLFHLNRFDSAENILKQAVALEPKMSSANISLGLLNLKKKNFKDALKYLQIAVNSAPENYLAHYFYALVLSREDAAENGMISTFEPKKALEIKQHLRKSIALKPDFADSYGLFALISIVQREDIDESLEMLEKALLISPGDQMFVLRKSELYLLKENFEKSREIAQNIFENSKDEKIKKLAENTLEKIISYKEQIERSKKTKLENPYLIEDDKQLTPRELEELSKKIEIDSININLRKLNVGEQRIFGKITGIECISAGVIFSVKSENPTLKFINKGFNGIFLYTYNIELKGGAIGCESDLSKFYSIVTYKSAGIKENNFDGEVVAIEFVPDYFVFN